MPKEIDDRQGRRLTRYLLGRSSDAEAAAVEAWIDADPAHAELAAEYLRLWSLTRQPLSDYDVDAAWQDIQARLDRPMGVEASPKTGRGPTRQFWLQAAAAALVAIGGATLWFTVSGRAPVVTDPVVHTYTTDPGQRGRLQLPDGTRVAMSVDTRLEVDDEFGRTHRGVRIVGEALFEVRSGHRLPFRVHVEGATIENVGTRFGVRRYGEDSATQVVVAEGRVAVQPTNEGGKGATIVNPGQLLRVRGVGGLEIQTEVDVATYLGWEEGRLVFVDTPLAEAAVQMSRWYNIQVHLADPDLGALRLTASFHEEPLSRVLEIISLSLDLRHERVGRSITFQQP